MSGSHEAPGAKEAYEVIYNALKKSDKSVQKSYKVQSAFPIIVEEKSIFSTKGLVRDGQSGSNFSSTYILLIYFWHKLTSRATARKIFNQKTDFVFRIYCLKK